jgi:hypothetical protein
VCDFLCISQSSVMLKTVFEFFIEHNPTAREALQSVVIDKDLREWKAIEEAFGVTVVLCIFHVLKWFKHVIAQPKYSIEFTLRESVLSCLRGMVFAVGKDALEAKKIELRGLLRPEDTVGHAAFLDYMEACRYGDEDMWSQAGRGFIFTAGNTTSNRLEAFWNQFKALLGSRRRLDYCLEAIFHHGTAILRREKEILQDYVFATPTLHDVNKKLHPMLMDLSLYASDHVKAQWTRMKALSSRYDATRSFPHGREAHIVYTVRSLGVVVVDFTVDATTWTCSCRSFCGIHLPCRHMFYVMDAIEAMASYPLAAVPKR